MQNKEINSLAKCFSSLNWIITNSDEEFISDLRQECENLVLRSNAKFSYSMKTIDIWDCFSGLHSSIDELALHNSFKKENYQIDLVSEAFKKFYNNNKPYSNLIIKDAHKIVNNKDWRMFINAIPKLLEDGKKVFFLSPHNLVFSEYSKDLFIYNYKLPDEKKRKYYISKVSRDLKDHFPSNFDFDVDEFTKLSAGLTMKEIGMGLKKCLVTENNLEINTSEFKKFKEDIVSKNSKINFLNNDISFNDIGGLDNLKNYIKRRFSKPEIQKSGIILLGLPGNGKTMFANALGNYLKIPSLYFDISLIFNKAIGESEKAMKSSLDTIESIGKCVLILDEIEKIIGGVASSNRTDGGTANRVFENLLNFLNKEDRECYVVATSNNIDELPAEFLRAGRFDTIFFVDFPNKFEVKQIFAKYCEKYKIDNWYTHYEFLNKNKLLENITGSEIKQLVLEFLYTQDENNKNGDWIEANKFVSRISKNSEKIKQIKKSNKNYINASLNEEEMQTLSISEDGDLIVNNL